MIDDRFDEFLEEAAQDYHRPPETPRDQIWASIEAARRASSPPSGRVADLGAFRRRRTTVLGLGLAAAAVLLIGVALGRLTTSPPQPASTPALSARDTKTPQPSVAATLAAVEHLSRVEALLSDYELGRTDTEFSALARDLLSRTRLWLDAGRVGDPRLRALLEDLELVLVQMTQLEPRGRDAERALIDEGLAERQIRPRLRNAVPAGPTA